ncbi:MAG: hypothetical protein DI589_06535 [Shinella sp.]|nr:MAG: hypothetical protein DI589_06535 [Shinella sp.]
MSEQLFLQQFDLIHKRLAEIREEGSERGRRQWEALNEVREQNAVMAHRISKLETSNEGQSEALEKYRRLEHQAQGAGWLGRKLLAVGGILIAGASSLYAAWDTIAAFIGRAR